MNHNAYNAGYTQVIKTAGITDKVKGWFTDDEPETPLWQRNLIAGQVGALVGLVGAVAGPNEFDEYVQGRSPRHTPSEKSFTRALRQESPHLKPDFDDIVQKFRSPDHGLWQNKIRELTGDKNLRLDKSVNYAAGLGEQTGHALLNYKHDLINPAQMLHEAGHATPSKVRGVDKVLKGLRGKGLPFAGAGAVAGTAMALSDNEDLENWAPVAAGVGGLAMIPEELRANINAEKYLKKLAPMSHDAGQFLRDGRKILAASMGNYAAIPLGLAAGAGVMSLAKKNWRRQEND